MNRVLTWALAGAVVALAGCANPGPTMAESPGAPLAVYAAGSLREVLTEIAASHETRTGQKERSEKGEAAMVFASANTEHPQRLANSGGWAPHQVFVRNGLCALTSDRVSTTPPTLLDTLLDPAIRVGTSTPKADPSGDYAWALFRKADALVPGAYARLDAKALKLTGGADSPKAPAGRGTYAWLMDQGQADVFLTYCTNAVAARQEVPRLRVVSVPPALQVGAAYGVTVRQGAPASAQAFGQALLAPWAQAIFARYGFEPPV